jgi:hypothetical protein
MVEPATPAIPSPLPEAPKGPTLADLLHGVRVPLQQADPKDDASWKARHSEAEQALVKVPPGSTISRYVLEAAIQFGKGEYEAAGDKVLGIEQRILSQPLYLEQIHTELGTPSHGLTSLFQSPSFQYLASEVDAYAQKWWTPRSLYFVLATCHLLQQEYVKAARIVKDRPDDGRPAKYRTLLTTLRGRTDAKLAAEQDPARKSGLEELRRKYDAALEVLK